MGDAPELPRAFREACDEIADRVFMEHHDGRRFTATLTGSELGDLSDRLGTWLQRRYVPQSAVLLAVQPGIEFVVGLLSCWQANLVAVPVASVDLPSSEVASKIGPMAADANIVCVLTDADHLDLFDGVEAFASIPVVDLSATARDVASVEPARACLPEDLGLLLYTSGSTAQPKGVQLSYRAIGACAELSCRLWHVDADTTVVSWLAMSHEFGLFVSCLAPPLRRSPRDHHPRRRLPG